MAQTTDLQDWMSRFVQASLSEEAVTRFVSLVDAEIMRTLPELAADPVLIEDLHRSTRHQWLAFLTTLRQPEHELSLPPQAADLARSLARRGLEVRVLLRVYLNAHHGVYAYLNQVIDELRNHESVPDDAIRSVWSRADLWMDESVVSLIETFYEERQRGIDGNAVRRAELADALIAGAEMNTAYAVETLQHPLGSWHTACQLWTGHVDDRTVHVLQGAADELSDIIEGGTVLAQLVGSRELRCWISTVTPPSEVQLEALGLHHIEGVSVAMGRPAAGVEGFRTSHLDARAAQYLSVSSPLSPRFVDYRGVEILCLALSEPEALARMVHREVGPLCGADKNLAPIRETVLTFLGNRMNVEATASHLFIHGNTVRYRLARAEEMLGCQLADRPRQVELALQYVAYFGPPPR